MIFRAFLPNLIKKFETSAGVMRNQEGRPCRIDPYSRLPLKRAAVTSARMERRGPRVDHGTLQSILITYTSGY